METEAKDEQSAQASNTPQVMDEAERRGADDFRAAITARQRQELYDDEGNLARSYILLQRKLADAQAALGKQPICACGDSFTAEAMCVNCAIGTPTDMQVAREANLKLVQRANQGDKMMQALMTENHRLKGKATRQRKELRRLNKYWGTFWTGHAVALSKART